MLQEPGHTEPLVFRQVYVCSFEGNVKAWHRVNTPQQALYHSNVFRSSLKLSQPHNLQIPGYSGTWHITALRRTLQQDYA